mmetsp:Transcript_42327/g.99325  ORF Transcript_42327/g.99325 Transcript_42327/m.99325 type:complete len:1420 (+) Transcript_42327:1301-5560(+)
MQLRKCCNHPFLLRGIEEDIRNNQKEQQNEAQFIANSSGKLILLDKLLPKLHKSGKRVLLFSQFKIMLNVIEDYLRLRDTSYERIDGSITGAKRQAAIDRFQKTKTTNGRPPPFLMLLSTKAGGVGINLTAADTCIIFDSDWNPQNDLQAMARCHRIGQTKNVKVYRLITRKTYEFHMFHMASLKMGLDQAVLHGINDKDDKSIKLSKEDLEGLLRHGAYDMLNEAKNGDAEKASTEFINTDIDAILAGAQVLTHKDTGSQSSAARGTFSKASFKINDENAHEANKEVDVDDPDFWKKMVGDSLPAVKHSVMGKRKRNVKSYSEFGDGNEKGDDSDYENLASSDDERQDSDGEDQQNEWHPNELKRLFSNLQTFGYDEVVRGVGHHPEVKDRAQLKHRCWAVLFCVLLELANMAKLATDTRFNALKAAEALKALETKTPETKNKTTKADAKANTPEPDTSEPESAEPVPSPVASPAETPKTASTDVETEFQKVYEEHKGFLCRALADAIEHKATASPRDISLFVRKTAVEKAFFDNLWPALQVRGWENTAKEEGGLELVPNAKFRKVYKRKYSTVKQRLLVDVVLFHPELKNVVESINVVIAEWEKDKNMDKELDQRGTQLSVDTLTYAKLSSFVEEYSPTDVLSFRTRSFFKLSTKKSFFEKLKYMGKVRKLMVVAPNTQMLHAIIPSSEVPVPNCNEWSKHHDVALLKAIEKHGWIENDANYEAIKKDKLIPWNALASVKPSQFNINILRQTAHRVLQFLQNAATQSEYKNCNFNQLASQFGISPESPESGKWRFDEKLLEESTTAKTDLRSRFPDKRVLAKRMKHILAKSLSPQSDTTESKKTNRGFTQLDLQDHNNFFLRYLFLTAAQKNISERNKVLTMALKEINKLQAGFAGNAYMTQIEQHIFYVMFCKRSTTRQNRNVLRAIVGMSPLQTEGEKLFPEETQEGVLLHYLEQQQKEFRNALKKSSKCFALGDVALSKLRVETTESSSKDSNVIWLSPCEVSLLHCLCSDGLPLLNETNLKFKDNPVVDLVDEGEDRNSMFLFNWDTLIQRYLIRLEEDLQKVRMELKFTRCGDVIDVNHLKAKENVIFFENMYTGLKNVANNAGHQLSFAQNIISMLESIKKNMGPIESYSKSGGVKKMNKSELNLGSKILHFFAKDITKWAQGLSVEHVFPKQSDRLKTRPLDASGCRHVFIQIAQQTRLRHLVVNNSELYFKEMLGKAIKNSRNNEDKWPQQPNWWSVYKPGEKNIPIEDDYDLVIGICKHGYGNFSKILSDPEIGLSKKEQGCPDENKLTPISVQIRINQLTRELSATSDTTDMMRIMKKKALNRSSLPLEGLSNSYVGVPTSPRDKKSHGIQSTLGFFFGAKSVGKTPNKNEEIVTINDDSSEESSCPTKRNVVESWTQAQKKVKTAA